MTNEKTNKTAAQNMAVIVQGLCDIGTAAAGEAIGRDHSFISRLKSGERKLTLDEFAVLTSSMGIAFRREADDEVTISKTLYLSLTQFAQIGMKTLSQDKQ